MEGESNWIGIECEGRYHGLPTYFIRYGIGTVPENIQHLYFTKEFWQQPDAAKQIEERSKQGYVISVEATKDTYMLLTPNIKVRCHILYRIEDVYPHDLKETDSIFIDKGMYNVLCFTKHQAYKVFPLDYANDTLCK